MIRESYRGRSILLTGATGFVGTALAEKILRSLPEIERLYLLIRPSESKSAPERFYDNVLSSSVFSKLRSELGDEGLEERALEKVRVLSGDVHESSLGLSKDALTELSENIDVVIHSAASVSFDAPLDGALDSNIKGTLGLLRLARDWEKRPLFVHISTAYVAGTRDGTIPEEPPGPTAPDGTPLDAATKIEELEAEIEAAHAASRTPELQRRFRTEAERELGMVGEEDEIAERAEQLRLDNVREQLVELGTARARELGWHDVYTFTKSLAERRVMEERGELPLIILRPAIVESSYSEPYPGWIQGSRMIDPIIMAYARGLLKEFPGDPQSVVDLIPADHVVNATLAVAATRPQEPAVYQVGSGQMNPLRYRQLYGYVREYFLANPLKDTTGRPIEVPEWSFPGRELVEARLKAELAGLKAGGAVVSRLREGHMVADVRGRISRAEKRARMSLYYSRIYGGYGSMKAIFSSEHTRELYRSLPNEEREEFPFDVTRIQWKRWLQGAHLPALTTRPGSKKRRRKEPEGGEVAAIFDVDGTLVDSNVVSFYAWLKMRELPPAQRPLWVAAFLPKVPYYWALDKVSRAHFNRAFYKNYRDWKPARAFQLGRESFEGYTLKKVFPEALQQLREHGEAGHRVVLLSGSLDFALEPFKDLADEVLSAKLEEENGTYTGELAGAPVAGEARARMLTSYARKRGIDLSRSYAYADSISDLPMLETVGNPVAVNPDRRLAAAAEDNGWHVERWRR